MWCKHEGAHRCREAMVGSGTAADTKDLLRGWKVALDNDYALHPAAHLGGAGTCSNACKRFKTTQRNIISHYIFLSEN